MSKYSYKEEGEKQQNTSYDDLSKTRKKTCIEKEIRLLYDGIAS